MQYRIIQVTKGSSIYFLLETKTFFSWKAERDSGVDDFGIFYFDRKFATKNEAHEHFIKTYKKSIRTIIESGKLMLR